MDTKWLREQIIKIIAEETKYLKTYTGKVIDVDDDEDRGRIKCYVMELYWVDGDSAVWIEPRYIRSMLKIKKDDYVQIGFTNGDRTRPYYFGKCNELKDMPCPSYDGDLQVLFESNDGDLLETYNDEDKELILTLKKDDNNSTTITKNKDGIIIEDCNGNKYTNDKDGIIKEDCNSNIETWDSNGITKEDANGNKVEMTSTGIKWTDANSNTVEMKASGIDMLAATEAFVKGTTTKTNFDTLLTLIKTHTHDVVGVQAGGSTITSSTSTGLAAATNPIDNSTKINGE